MKSHAIPVEETATVHVRQTPEDRQALDQRGQGGGQTGGQAQAKEVVEVEWVDSSIAGAWTDPHEADGLDLHCWSVGYLMEDSNDRIMLLMGFGQAFGQYLCPVVIPRQAVLSMRRLTR